MGEREVAKDLSGRSEEIYPYLAGQLNDKVWALDVRREADVRALMRAWAVGDQPNQPVMQGDRTTGASVPSIAVIPVHGMINHRFDFGSWMRSTIAIRAEVDDALNDPNVAAIILDVDSPGGIVDGTPELFDYLMGVRGTKPIIAVANTLMASGAYYIAAAADEIVVTPSGEVGSIGVFLLHVDFSRMLDAEGITPTFIRQPPAKAEGNPWEPLSEDALEHFQGQVDTLYGEFVKAVAKGRGVKVSDVRSGFGEGRTVLAQEAKEVGLVDRVATFEQVVAGLSRQVKSGRRPRSDRDLVALSLARFRPQPPA